MAGDRTTDRSVFSPLRGPDLKITVGGEIVIIDVSGIRDGTWTQLSGYGRNGALSRLQYNNTSHAIAPPPRSVTTPTEERDRTKYNSADAKWTAKNMGTYTAGTFVHSGGLSAEFGRMIERTIGRTDSAPPESRDRSIRTHAALAKQAVQATIVNTHGATVMANQKKAYDRLGRNDEQIGWWNAEDTATVPLVALLRGISAITARQQVSRSSMRNLNRGPQQVRRTTTMRKKTTDGITRRERIEATPPECRSHR